MDEFKSIEVNQDGKLLNVTLSRGDIGNPIDETFLDELSYVLSNLNDEVRVLVLAASGKDFSTGGSRHELKPEVHEGSASDMNRIARKARSACEALSSCDAVTIAKLHGKVIGAGLAIALFCDLRVGLSNSKFRLPELTLGMPTAWGGSLPRMISEVGTSRIRELLLTSREFDADEACEFNIIHYAFSESEVDGAIDKIIRPLLRRPKEPLRVTKQMFSAFSAQNRMGDVTWLEGSLMRASAQFN